jgi:gluconate 2-dehydrogenase gamma chain
MAEATQPMIEATQATTVVSRRFFLQATVAAGGVVVVGCAPIGGEPEVTAEPDTGFLSTSERRTVQAITGRIMPGSADDPGAVEAGVVDYIDRKLASFEGFAEPAYLHGPFVEVIESGPVPPPEIALAVAADQAYRYGYQSGVLPQELYRRGLVAIDDLARTRGGAPFAELGPEEQDALLTVLDTIQLRAEGETGDPDVTQSETDAAEDAFGEVGAGAFFGTVRTDTIEGMFADPSYGGNEELVGWALIGWPGARRGYSPAEMLVGTRRRPQPLEELADMNPDRHSGHLPPALEQPMRGVHDG